MSRWHGPRPRRSLSRRGQALCESRCQDRPGPLAWRQLTEWHAPRPRPAPQAPPAGAPTRRRGVGPEAPPVWRLAFSFQRPAGPPGVVADSPRGSPPAASRYGATAGGSQAAPPVACRGQTPGSAATCAVVTMGAGAAAWTRSSAPNRAQPRLCPSPGRPPVRREWRSCARRSSPPQLSSPVRPCPRSGPRSHRRHTPLRHTHRR